MGEHDYDHDEMLLPLPDEMRPLATLEMIVPNHDFGPRIGIRDAIRVRDILLLSNVSDEEMQEIDRIRTEQNLPPLFSDDELCKYPFA